MCDALLSCDFLDNGLLGELKSLGEVVGLTLAVEGLGIFKLMDISLCCLHETNKTKKKQKKTKKKQKKKTKKKNKILFTYKKIWQQKLI